MAVVLALHFNKFKYFLYRIFDIDPSFGIMHNAVWCTHSKVFLGLSVVENNKYLNKYEYNKNE